MSTTYSNYRGLVLFTSFLLSNLGAVDYALFTKEGTPTMKLKKILDFFSIKEADPQKIVDITQEWCRPQGFERWQVSGDQIERHDEFIKLIEELEMYQQVDPTESEYDYVLILGALAERMGLRIGHIVELLKSKKIKVGKIVTLAGARPLDKQKESPEVLAELLGTMPTEEEYAAAHEGTIFSKLAAKYKLSDYAPLVEITVEMFTDPVTGKQRRPTTGDTIIAFMEKEKVVVELGKKMRILVISNQPFVPYQHAVVKTYLPHSSIETIGQNGNLQSDRVYLDTIARWIYQEHEYLKMNKKS